jgi:putative addiction module component (TIGR02574 family)
MNARIHHILDEALALEQNERSALVLALLESLDEVSGDGEITPAWNTEIQFRKARLRAGTTKPVPWAEAKARLLAL